MSGKYDKFLGAYREDDLSVTSPSGLYVLRAGDTMTGDLTVDTLVHTPTIQAHSSAGLVIEAFGGADIMLLGAGGAQTATFYDGVNFNAGTANGVAYLGASKSFTTGTNLTFNGTKLSVVSATSVTDALRLGSDVDLYRSAADELRTPDSLVVDGNAAFGTSRDSRYTIRGARTGSTNESTTVFRGDLTLTGAVTSQFPTASNFSATINAGANGISFVSGNFFSVRSDLTQSGTIGEQYGVYGDVWHRSQGNVTVMGGGRAFLNIIAGSAGTIANLYGWQSVFATNAGGTNPAITTAYAFYSQTAHAGSATITTWTHFRTDSFDTAGSGTYTTYRGLDITNPGSGSTITTLEGIKIRALTRGTNNYAFGSDAGNKHGFGTFSPSAIVHTAGAITSTAWTTSGINIRTDAATYTDSSSSGTVASMGVNAIGRPTVAASNSTTYTDGATLYISNSPANGTNVTITNPWSIWIDSGNVRFDGQLRIDQRAYAGVSTLTDGATVSLDASLGNTFLLTAAGDRTISAPTNATSGQRIIIAHKASGANRTLTLTTGSSGAFRFGTDITGLTATTSGLTDYIGCVYNSADARWDIVSYRKGY